MRYTEARLSRIATALLEDIDKETVDFRPNYDESEVRAGSSAHARSEPSGQRIFGNRGRHGDQHPAAQPDRNHRSHHPADPPSGNAARRRSWRSCRARISRPAVSSSGRQGILDAFRTGRGSLKIRAKAVIEKMGKGDREQIVVTEIPYQVNKSRLIENAAALVNEKKIEGISEIRDESDRDGMRIVFELKRGEQAEVILNNLYKNTQLQISFGIINLSIVNGQPRELGLISTIKYFIEHRADVVRRRTDFELRKAREREHILLGFRAGARQYRRSDPADPGRRSRPRKRANR